MRRRVLLTGGAISLGASCAREDVRVASVLRLMARQQDLIILSRTMVAIDTEGNGVGRLSLPDCCRSPVYVSTDGKSVSWVRTGGQAPPSQEALGRVMTVRQGQRVSESAYPGRFWLSAMDDEGARLAAVVHSISGRGSRLVVFDRLGGGVIDLSAFHSNLRGGDIETLRMSSRGDVVSVGTRERLTVIGLNPPSVLFAGAGRFPILTPDGARVSYVSDGRLTVTSLVNGHARRLMGGTSAYGVGGWSPDGRFLLVGGRIRLTFHLTLTGVDVAEDRFAEIGSLPEGEYGSGYFWMKRDLLT